MKFADPRNDIAFKKIFGNAAHKEVLIHFINAALDFPEGAKVVDVSFTNPYQPPKIEDLKETILDVTATDQKNRTFIVEMQMQRDSYFAKRSLYYTAKSYINQLDAGEDYVLLKSVYFIGILDFHFSAVPGQYLSNHLILNRQTGEHQLDDFGFCFIELPKFNKTLEQLENTVDKWIYFFKHASQLEAIPKTYQQDTIFQTAFQVVQQHSWTKHEREVYDYMSMRRGQELSQIRSAREEGENIGLEKGEQIGLQKGEQIGLQKGEKLLAQRLVPQLVAKNISDEEIATMLGLSTKEIEEIRSD